MAYYPLNYEINYYGTNYSFNATELAWLTALLQGTNKIYNNLDATNNSDVQSLFQKGLIDADGILTRQGIFIASYVFIAHPMIHENPLFALTYEYIFNPDTIGTNMQTKFESVEPKYNFQKKLKKYADKANSMKESFKVKPVVRIEDLEEAVAVMTKEPFKDVVLLKSSFLKGLAYNDDTQEMDVHMTDGKIYRYSNVPSMVFTAFRTADTRVVDDDQKKKDGSDLKKMSIGSYYASKIKGNKDYPAIRIK